jgi:hypothetical protein
VPLPHLSGLVIERVFRPGNSVRIQAWTNGRMVLCPGCDTAGWFLGARPGMSIGSAPQIHRVNSGDCSSGAGAEELILRAM